MVVALTILGWLLVAGGVVVLARLLFRGAREPQPAIHMPDVTQREALRLLLAKAQREVDVLNGVRR